MKKIIEINYGRSLKFNKGNYEQDSPMWHEKVTIELNGKDDHEAVEQETYDALKKRVDERANQEWLRSKNEMAHLRIRTRNGKQYPSVTSIINPEPYTNDPEYGTRGTELERVVNVFIDTGIWIEPEVTLKNLSYDQIPYKEFFEKFGTRLDFRKCERQIEVYNEKYLYSGAIDKICKVDGKKTLADWKTGGWKWRQLIAYKQCGIEVEQLAIFDLKKCALELLPVNSEGFQVGWEGFLIDRGVFKGRFGI